MKYRIDLTKDEYDILDSIISTYFNDMEDYFEGIDKEYIFNKTIEKIENPKVIKESEKKELAALNATKTRTKRVKEKIQNAINILRMENKEITPYQVSKVSGVSFITCKKYLK